MLPYIRTRFALGHASTGTVSLMPSPRRWSLVVPLIGLAVAVVLLPVAQAALVPVTLRPILGYLVVWVPLAVGAIIATARASRRSEERWSSVLGIRSTVTGVLVGVFVGLMVRSLAVLMELLVTGRISGGAAGFDDASADVVGLLAVLAASVIVAPVIEETFFRGVLQPALIERSGTGRAAAWIGIAATAAVFAVVHALAGSSVLGAVVTLAAGVGFGLVARSSGLVSAIVAHVVFNASGIAFVLANGPVSPLRPTLGLG
jgi:membrane protease YdiL (CAAX protease family)